MKIRGWALVPRSTVNKRLWTLEKKFCKRIYHCVIVRKINDRMCGLNLKWSCWHFRARVLSPGCIRFWSSLKFTVTKKVTVSWGACAVEFIETDLRKGRIRWIFSVQTELFTQNVFTCSPFASVFTLHFDVYRNEDEKSLGLLRSPHAPVNY